MDKTTLQEDIDQVDSMLRGGGNKIVDGKLVKMTPEEIAEENKQRDELTRKIEEAAAEFDEEGNAPGDPGYGGPGGKEKSG